MLVLSSWINSTADLLSIPHETVHENNTMRKVELYSDRSIAQLNLTNYRRFFFVRHPFERLVSAYYNKFVDGNNGRTYQLNIGTKIVRMFRPHPSAESLEKGNDVTFPEFVSFVVHQWKRRRIEPIDVHWRPMVDLCLPCSINYDMIGKFETLQQDLTLLLRSIGQGPMMRLIQQSTSSPITNAARLDNAMKKLSSQQRESLATIYKDDFDLFNYSP